MNLLKDLVMKRIQQFFPKENVESLHQYLPNITRMTNENIELKTILSELKTNLEDIQGLSH